MVRALTVEMFWEQNSDSATTGKRLRLVGKINSCRLF